MTDAAWMPSCPAGSRASGELVTLAHGEGGLLSRRLISKIIVSRLGNTLLDSQADAGVLPPSTASLAITTDSFVVSPLFFPGGDIGTLAVFGTVNDLAVSGARPQWLSVSLILEEGLPLEILQCVLDSIAHAAYQAGVAVVTGDTKVVPRGAADRLFITTTGVGELLDPVPPGPRAIAPGDVLIVSGPIARHGIAVLNAREDLGFEPPPQSDCSSLWPAVEALRIAGIRPKAMRDATRGGVSAVLHEWSAACGCTMAIEEARIPLTPDIRAACELLGLDPLHVANEGTMVVVVPGDQADRTVDAFRRRPLTSAAARIGTVDPPSIAPVTVCRTLGRKQPLDEPLGAPLPRIC